MFAIHAVKKTSAIKEMDLKRPSSLEHRGSRCRGACLHLGAFFCGAFCKSGHEHNLYMRLLFLYQRLTDN